MKELTDRIASSVVTRGIWQTLPGPEAAERAARAGFARVVIDGDHGHWHAGDIRARLIAVPDALTRVPRAGDRGLKQARSTLGHATYRCRWWTMRIRPRRRSRPAAIRQRRGAACGPSSCAVMYPLDPGYVSRATAEVSVWVHAERRAALANVGAISRAPGDDCVFPGPADNAADLGTTASDPAAVRALEDAIARMVAGGHRDRSSLRRSRALDRGRRADRGVGV